jgi:hypothetical protein
LATSIEIQRLKPARKKGPAAGPQGLSAGLSCIFRASVPIESERRPYFFI